MNEIKEHYQKITRKGGLAVKKKYGKKYFSELAKKRWNKVKKTKHETSSKGV